MAMVDGGGDDVAAAISDLMSNVGMPETEDDIGDDDDGASDAIVAKRRRVGSGSQMLAMPSTGQAKVLRGPNRQKDKK